MDNSRDINRSAGLRLYCVEQRFGKRVIVAYPWPGEGEGDSQLRDLSGQGK